MPVEVLPPVFVYLRARLPDVVEEGGEAEPEIGRYAAAYLDHVPVDVVAVPFRVLRESDACTYLRYRGGDDVGILEQDLAEPP